MAILLDVETDPGIAVVPVCDTSRVVHVAEILIKRYPDISVALSKLFIVWLTKLIFDVTNSFALYTIFVIALYSLFDLFAVIGILFISFKTLVVSYF